MSAESREELPIQFEHEQIDGLIEEQILYPPTLGNVAMDIYHKLDGLARDIRYEENPDDNMGVRIASWVERGKSKDGYALAVTECKSAEESTGGLVMGCVLMKVDRHKLSLDPHYPKLHTYNSRNSTPKQLDGMINLFRPDPRGEDLSQDMKFMVGLLDRIKEKSEDEKEGTEFDSKVGEAVAKAYGKIIKEFFSKPQPEIVPKIYNPIEDPDLPTEPQGAA